MSDFLLIIDVKLKKRLEIAKLKKYRSYCVLCNF